MSFKSRKTTSSKTLKGILFFMLLTFCLFESFGQEISKEDLIGIDGNWSGSLTYTDYGDDKTKYTLQTNLTASVKEGSVKLQYAYKEPNGKVVTSTEKMKLGEGDTFTYGGKLRVLEFSKNPTEKSWRLVLEKTGKDNHQSVVIQQIIELSPEAFSITKMVKYDGTDSFFQRNKHTFNK